MCALLSLGVWDLGDACGDGVYGMLSGLGIGSGGAGVVELWNERSACYVDSVLVLEEGLDINVSHGVRSGCVVGALE